MAYQLRWAPQFPIDTFFASLLTRMTEYIFIENDKFKSHFSIFPFSGNGCKTMDAFVACQVDYEKIWIEDGPTFYGFTQSKQFKTWFNSRLYNELSWLQHFIKLGVCRGLVMHSGNVFQIGSLQRPKPSGRVLENTKSMAPFLSLFFRFKLANVRSELPNYWLVSVTQLTPITQTWKNEIWTCHFK